MYILQFLIGYQAPTLGVELCNRIRPDCVKSAENARFFSVFTKHKMAESGLSRKRRARDVFSPGENAVRPSRATGKRGSRHVKPKKKKLPHGNRPGEREIRAIARERTEMVMNKLKDNGMLVGITCLLVCVCFFIFLTLFRLQIDQLQVEKRALVIRLDRTTNRLTQMGHRNTVSFVCC